MIVSKVLDVSVRVNYFVTRELLCNRLPVLVKCRKSYKGRSRFFTFVRHKVFHVKILVFIISALFTYCRVKNSRQDQAN